jgi:prepilin-type N-terminal cleavage/methylation domain-containing protein
MNAAIRRDRRAGGFTLVEVMITLVILAFGMLTLAVMQLYALRQGSAGRHTGDGTAIARSYLEQASRVPWSELTTAQTAGGWQVPGWADVPAASVTLDRPGGAADSTEHAYTIRWRVTNIGTTPICLRDVEVRVQWTEQGTSAQKEHILGTRRYNSGDSSC